MFPLSGPGCLISGYFSQCCLCVCAGLDKAASQPQELKHMCVYGEVLQSLYPMGHKQTPPLYCFRTGSDMVSHRMSLIPAGRVSLLEGNKPMVTHTCWHVLVHGPGSCVYRINRQDGLFLCLWPETLHKCRRECLIKNAVLLCVYFCWRQQTYVLKWVIVYFKCLGH